MAIEIVRHRLHAAVRGPPAAPLLAGRRSPPSSTRSPTQAVKTRRLLDLRRAPAAVGRAQRCHRGDDRRAARRVPDDRTRIPGGGARRHGRAAGRDLRVLRHRRPPRTTPTTPRSACARSRSSTSPTPPTRTVIHRYKANVPVLSNLTGASQGTGAGKRLFLSRPYVDGADAGDGVEALVTSGDNLRQLTGDPPERAVPRARADRPSYPVYVHQGDVPPIVPPPGSTGAPARGIELAADTPPDGRRGHPARPAAARRQRRSASPTPDGTPRTPTRVFEVHLRNRWTTWRYREQERRLGHVDRGRPAAAHLLRQRRHEAEAVDRAPIGVERRHQPTRRRSPVSSRTSTSSRARTPTAGRKAMATTYKTPGVYIEEIPKFPPSVAPGRHRDPGVHRLHREGHRPGRPRPDPQAQAHRVAGRVRAVLRRPAARDRASPSPSRRSTVPTPGKPVGRHGDRDARRGRPLEAHPVLRAAAVLRQRRQVLLHRLGRAVQGASATALVASELEAALAPLSKVDEPTLIVIPEAQALGHRRLRDAAERTPSPSATTLKDRFVIMDVHGDDESLSDPDADLLDRRRELPRPTAPAQNLKYGAAYAPNLETILDFAFDEAQIDGHAHRRRRARPPATPSSTRSRRPRQPAATSGPRRRSATCR